MSKLKQTLDRLVAELASDVLAAIRQMPLDELLSMARAGSRRTKPQASRADRRPRPSPSLTRPSKAKRASRRRDLPRPTPARVDELTLDAAARFLEERGARGATEPQLRDALKERGIELDESAELLRTLAERNVARDAGFRRTTGKGTAPVYVIAR